MAHLWVWRKKWRKENESQATDHAKPAHLPYIIHGTPSINGSGIHAVENSTPLVRNFWMLTEQIDWFLARETLAREKVPKSVCLMPCFLVATRANWDHYWTQHACANALAASMCQWQMHISNRTIRCLHLHNLVALHLHYKVQRYSNKTKWLKNANTYNIAPHLLLLTALWWL